MIAPVDRVQRGTGQASEQRPEQVHVAEGVARALDEQRRDGDGWKMVGTELLRLPGRVQRIAEKEEGLHWGATRRQVRGDPSPERLAADRDPRRRECPVLRDRVEDGTVAALQDRARIR